MLDRVIIADDLTGALDAAAPFAARGIATKVAMDVSALHEAIAAGGRIVGVSTDSRELSPDTAREAVQQALAELPKGVAVFKKIDSRLKGNIAAELDAFVYNRSLVVPAIPSFGRWVRNGFLDGFGVSSPVDVAERLGVHRAKAMIPDVVDQSDLERLLLADCDLFIGARGLAEAMAVQMAPNAASPDISLPQSRALCVIGSTDPITLGQLHNLRKLDPDLVYIEAPNGIAPSWLPAPGRLTVIHAVPGAIAAEGTMVAESLGRSLSRLAPEPGSLLVLSGGATAQVILRQLGIRILELVGEAQAGLPLARAGDYTVITKSGGFGDPQTLCRLTETYRRPGSVAQHHDG
jgi:uncharacterized protein YgbK (DUF1537 family)